jgi:hypothetical protein
MKRMICGNLFEQKTGRNLTIAQNGRNLKIDEKDNSHAGDTAVHLYSFCHRFFT